MPDNVILGGGIAGIAAAYFARQRGIDATVYEALDSPGGLADSFSVEGFRFDNAAHISFATEPEVRAVFDRTPYRTLFADAWCWEDGHWLRHPVQNNLFPLPAADKVELIAGVLERPQLHEHNYRDWLIAQYGEAIATRFPMRYTRKYWTVPAQDLSTTWIANRMRRSDVQEILFGAMSPDTPHTYYLSEVRYPERGGYRAFLEPMLAECDVRCDHRVTAVDPRSRSVTFADGATSGYRRMISTLALPALIPMIADVPADIRAAASSLFATAVDLISVGFSRPDVPTRLVTYVYDEDILAARICASSLTSPNNAPDGCSSLQFEIYSSPRRPQTASVEEMKRNTLMAIERLGLARSEDVVLLHHKRLPYGNIVYDHGMEERRDRVRDWLARQGIVTAGRFGEWNYLWSNQSFMSGMRASRGFSE